MREGERLIPWLIVGAAAGAALGGMYFANGKKQERRILWWMFVAVFVASCAALFLEGYLGGSSGWLKSVCFGLNLVVLLRIDDTKKKKRRR